VKANDASWYADNIDVQIKAELSYIGNYLNTSDSEFVTLSGTNQEKLATLQKHHDQELSTMRTNHNSQLGLMRQRHDQQLDALWDANYEPTYILIVQNTLLEQEKTLGDLQLKIERQLINVQLEQERRFVPLQNQNFEASVHQPAL
jgi:hypothetical protein